MSANKVIMSIIKNGVNEEKLEELRASFEIMRIQLSEINTLSCVNDLQSYFIHTVKKRYIKDCEDYCENLSSMADCPSTTDLELSVLYEITKVLKMTIDIYKEIVNGSNVSIIREKEKKFREHKENLKIAFIPNIEDGDMKELFNLFVEETMYVSNNIDIYEVFVKKFNKLKEEQKKQDEDLVRMMEETKLTKDKRKQQEKQQAKNANQEHLRKKKEREEFYRKSGMLGAKPTKKSHKK